MYSNPTVPFSSPSADLHSSYNETITDIDDTIVDSSPSPSSFPPPLPTEIPQSHSSSSSSPVLRRIPKPRSSAKIPLPTHPSALSSSSTNINANDYHNVNMKNSHDSHLQHPVNPMVHTISPPFLSTDPLILPPKPFRDPRRVEGILRSHIQSQHSHIISPLAVPSPNSSLYLNTLVNTIQNITSNPPASMFKNVLDNKLRDKRTQQEITKKSLSYSLHERKYGDMDIAPLGISKEKEREREKEGRERERREKEREKERKRREKEEERERERREREKGDEDFYFETNNGIMETDLHDDHNVRDENSAPSWSIRPSFGDSQPSSLSSHHITPPPFTFPSSNPPPPSSPSSLSPSSPSPHSFSIDQLMKEKLSISSPSPSSPSSSPWSSASEYYDRMQHLYDEITDDMNQQEMQRRTKNLRK